MAGLLLLDPSVVLFEISTASPSCLIMMCLGIGGMDDIVDAVMFLFCDLFFTS